MVSDMSNTHECLNHNHEAALKFQLRLALLFQSNPLATSTKVINKTQVNIL